MPGRRLRTAIALVAMGISVIGGGIARAADAGTVTNEFVTSSDGTKIAVSIFQPLTADATHQVPMILHSHGWGGSRSTTVSSFNSWLAAGFGVLSFDQRGHGQTGSVATVEDPNFEGQDVKAIIDRVAQLEWVRHDVDGNGDPIADDPVLGAIGGSYGGGYQTMGALTEVRDRGRTRFNALAPEITWFDLPESLAPQGVPRTLWTTLLYAVAPPHASYIDQGEATGLATGDFPDGTVPGTVNLKQIFYEHSPHYFADHGMPLDIPVLFGQGQTDNLFNLNQGWHNFTDVLSPSARAKSVLVGYNSGHVLPQVLPLASNPTGNKCVTNWGDFERAFFTSAFGGGNPRLDLGVKAFNLSANEGTSCIRTDSLSDYQTVAAGPAGAIVSPSGAGAPFSIELAKGPLTLAGIPRIRGKLTTIGADVRAFFAISVGTTPADATVVQNNVMPIRSLLPAVMESITRELPGIAVSVPAGSNVYLTISPVSDMFVGNYRAPGALVISDAVVDLPVKS